MPAVTRAGWLNLVGCAIAGTAKRAPASQPEDREGGALAEAALLGTALRAGCKPREAVESLPPALAETLPLARNSARHLRRCFELSPEMVKIWLETAAEARVAVPPECLVDILDFGAKDRRYAPVVRKVCGSRGAWLAEHNPEWKYALGELSDEDVWENGTQSERIEAIERIQAVDRALAISLVKASFASEPADFRAASIAAVGRWHGEKEFLVGLLADRSLAVREAAIGALAVMPDGEASGAARAIVVDLVKTVKGFLKRSTSINLPPISEAPKREPKNWLERFAQTWPKSVQGVGWRENLLTNMIGLVDPETWVPHLAVKPPEILASLAKHEHGGAFLTGVGRATVRFHNREWAYAMLRSDAAHGEGTKMIEVLSAPEIDRLLVEFAAKGKRQWQFYALQLPTWSPDLSHALLRELRTRIDEGCTTADFLEHAVRLAPETHGEALRLAASEQTTSLASWQVALPLLNEMRAAINSAAKQT